MLNPKAQFYTTQLYSSLTAGDWSAEFPSKGLRKGNLSWSELLRKFRKHRPDAPELADIASHTQTLCVLLSHTHPPTPESLDGDHLIPHEPLRLGNECLLKEEDKKAGVSGYQALQKLPPSDSSWLAMAYYAFALGQPVDTLKHIESVNFDNLPSYINASNTGTGSSSISYPISHDSSGATASLLSSLPALEADMKAGKLWMAVEFIRGKCLQGMAYESLGSYHEALQSYSGSLPFLDRISIPKSLSSASLNTSPYEPFTHFREVWRWVERLLWRAAILSAKLHSPFHDNTLHLLRLYQSNSVHWPSTFRPEHRSMISMLYLHLLLRIYNNFTTLCPSKSLWLNEVRSVVTDYRVVLTSTTTFPHAGQVNAKVEEFVDICMAAWEICGASGDQTGWIIDILWWATRFTFNSHRIYRHLTRTLYASGDSELARRTLKLYVQVVNKERETKVGGEPDRVWIETLVQGARMLCRIPNGGASEARQAGEIIELIEKRLDEHGHNGGHEDLKAAVLRAKGIWHTCMAMREHEPRTRPGHFESAITAFKSSLILDSSCPSTHFHLALALTRPGPGRDLNTAVNHARSAVVGDPKEIRYWHLLGLLLTATEEWKSAREVFLEGMRIAEEEELLEQPLPSNGGSPGKINGSGASETSEGKDALASVLSNGASQDSFLALDAYSLPPAATFLQLAPDYPPPTRHERFEYALQIRLTLLALIEHVEGAENAGDGWLEVFRWVAGRQGLGEERRPPSVEPPPSDPSMMDIPDGHSKDSVHLSLNKSTMRSRKTLYSEESPIDSDKPAHNNINNPPSILVEMHDDDQRGQSPLENGERKRRSSGDGTDSKRKNKNVQQILKAQVHKSQAHIHTISRKIGRGHLAAAGAKAGARLKRASSAPDFRISIGQHKKQVQYQASSIHSRPRLSSTYVRSITPTDRSISQNQPVLSETANNGGIDRSVLANRSWRERRLLSNLWLTSAATFRRMGKIEQALTAIQEAEAADENNENVWVQLGLYHAALGEQEKAIASFYKALFINPDCVSAFVYLTKEYLTPCSATSPTLYSSAEEDQPPATTSRSATEIPAASSVKDNVDLAAGLMHKITRGPGWDVPEAWYFLAKALGMQGKTDRERECLVYASSLLEGRGVRDIADAIGWWL